MKSSSLIAVFSMILTVIAEVSCGPAESLPPTTDAGTSNGGGTSNDGGTNNDADSQCAGQCVPGLPGEWRGPVLLWVGDEAAAPPCPTNARLEIFAGYGDSSGPPCGACKCDQPIGSCELPSKLTSSSALCAGDPQGTFQFYFDPPLNWDGTCTTANALAAQKICGGVPCVQSVTIAPMTMTQKGGCLPIEPPPAPPSVWQTFARACSDSSFAKDCGTMVGACAAIPPGPEFKTCIHLKGDPVTLHCPATYPIPSVFYTDAAPLCSPCACGAPTGSTCAGTIEIFQNGTCGAPLAPPIAIDEIGPKCVDVTPGSGLGSKTASVSYNPGACTPSGGASQGRVFCCLP